MGLQEESAGYRTKGAYSIRTVVILLILAFACGLAAMGWATSRWHGWWDRKQVVVQEQRPGAQDMINNDAGVKGSAVDAPPPAIDGDHAPALPTRAPDLDPPISPPHLQPHATTRPPTT